MKICVALRNTAPRDLKAGNLRGEPRWERQVLEACIQSPLVKEVYTARCIWERGQAVSQKYKGLITSEAAGDVVLIIHDYNLPVIKQYRYKGVLVNVYAGDWQKKYAANVDATASYGNRFFFAFGYPFMYRRLLSPESIFYPPDKSLTKENVVLLPVPGAPEAEYENRFNNKTILWARRAIHFYMLGEDPGFVWALEKLKEDSSLTLCVLFGWRKGMAGDFIGGKRVRIPDDIGSYFWSREEFKPHLSLKPRIKFEGSLSWREVLKRYSQAKIMAHVGRYFGAPSIEAALHGVPFVGTNAKEGSLVDCPGYLQTGDPVEACSILDRLMVDEEFYTKTAFSYHKYVAEHYTYEAFCLNLFTILKARNLV